MKLKEVYPVFSNVLTFAIFLLIGLEIREGAQKPREALLPTLCAAGGMTVPALIFLALQPGTNIWAITMPTDVALALGALSFLGKKVNPAVRLFLLMLAVADDLLSLAVIAIFFSDHLEFASVIYTFGAVLIGLIAPYRTKVLSVVAPLVTYFAIPMYIFLNLLSKLDFTFASSQVVWAIVFARVLGKVVGITFIAWLIFKLKPSMHPRGLTLSEISGIGALAGMGLTVSLVIAEIAVDGDAALSEVRIGLFFAALISGTLGTLWLKRSLPS